MLLLTTLLGAITILILAIVFQSALAGPIQIYSAVAIRAEGYAVRYVIDIAVRGNDSALSLLEK